MSKSNLPRYDTVRGQRRKVYSGITIVRDIEAFMHVAVIRAAVYMGDQHCPYYEEFDENDFAGTHLLAYKNGEPVGCLRIRYFGAFVKLERLAVMPAYRKSRLAFRLISAARDFCLKKGFVTFYGHAQKGVENLWMYMGASPVSGKSQFVFSDYSYTEMSCTLDADPTAFNIDTSPYTLIAPEGRWDVPGPLELSASRGSKD